MRPTCTAGAVLLLAVTSLAATCEATTIDFETPPLGGALRQVIDPYVVGGVTFTAVDEFQLDGVVGVVRECALFGAICADPPIENQVLGTGAYAGLLAPPLGEGGFAILATFAPDPANPVMTVSVDILWVPSNSGSYAYLSLANSSGTVVGSAECQACSTLTAVASEPVAYAGINTEDPFASCEPGLLWCPGFAIDTFTFSSSTTPTRPTTWGSIKTLYR